ncbi:MAG TPA: hypothetical protein VGN12_00915 [Pirellulales bacterium]|jgi:hypothetical protein
MTRAMPRRRLPDHIAEAMAVILDYVWQKEAQDYLSKSREEQEGHIFTDVLTVRQWLSGVSKSRRRELKR